jgi:hypothetical protein
LDFVWRSLGLANKICADQREERREAEYGTKC